VVEDAAPLRNALARYLREQGYDVGTAGSAPEALAYLRNHQVMLLLVDIRLPGMSGVDLLPEALAIDPDLGIMMLTGVADATSAATCMQRGALDYLVKPIELSDLSRAIQQALRRRATALEGQELTTWLREEADRRTAEVEQERQGSQESLSRRALGADRRARGHDRG
jgi:putative two-component system response regulator